MKKLHGNAKEGCVIDDSAPAVSSSTASRKACVELGTASAGGMISCRLTGEELTAYDSLCSELRARSRSDGVRLVIRMASGFLEFSQTDTGHLSALRHDLHRIGTGVNQLALAAKRGRIDLARDRWEVLDALRRELPGMRSLLGQVVAERRRQGRALFRAFLAAEEGNNG